jgi:hypothetical protein
MVSFTPCPFTTWEATPGTHWTGGLVDPKTGLDDMEKWKFLTLPGLKLQPLGPPVGNQPLYRLRYHGSCAVSELIYDRQSVGQSVLVSGAHLGPVTNFSFSLKFLIDIYGFVSS